MKIVANTEVDVPYKEAKSFVIRFLEEEYGFPDSNLFMFEGAWYEDKIHPHDNKSCGKTKVREATKMEQYVDRVIQGLRSEEE